MYFYFLLVPCIRRHFNRLLLWNNVFIVDPVTFEQKLTAKHSSWIQFDENASICESSTKFIPYKLITRRFGVADFNLWTFITS